MMKLSEAIRLGALLLPRSNSYLEEPLSSDCKAFLPPTACCALGGAALAAGFQRPRDVFIQDFLAQHWGAMLNRAVPHPVHGILRTVWEVINGLNSTVCYGWTRERIADWVATLEQELDIQEVPHATTECASGTKVGRF